VGSAVDGHSVTRRPQGPGRDDRHTLQTGGGIASPDSVSLPHCQPVRKVGRGLLVGAQSAGPSTVTKCQRSLTHTLGFTAVSRRCIHNYGFSRIQNAKVRNRIILLMSLSSSTEHRII
jgi:hypothetical protein